MKMKLLFVLLMCSVAYGMDEDLLVGEIEEGNHQVWALALSKKTNVPVETAHSLLDFYEEHTSPDEYHVFLQAIGHKGKKEARLLKILIKAQAEHSEMFERQIVQAQELADRNSQSTQKALFIARLRLYVAIAAGIISTISLTMNVLQATNVIG